MNRITIFWIEDNPIQNNVDIVKGKEYPKLFHENLFDYCIFQHPKQVEEYLSLMNALNGRVKFLAIKCQGALPDIIVFDYKLSEAFTNNNNALSYTDDDQYKFLKDTSASHKIKEVFPDITNEVLFLDRSDVRDGLYMGDKFKSEIKADKILQDDEFGLYCGITILREFKEHASVGVPATINKFEKSAMSYNSLFYEWVNSYDLKGAIERPVKIDEVKNWSKILEFSTDLLRKRIVIQVESGKIQLDLQQLIDLNSGKFPAFDNHDERIFTFTSVYGTRHLPLDGLFIDTGLPERDEAIKNWAGELLDTWSKSTGFKFQEYEKASEIS